MHWTEYIVFFLLSILASLLASGISRDYWPAGVKAFFKYVVPGLIFLALSFWYVLTGERVEDTVAKEIFCRVYSFGVCNKPHSMEARPTPEATIREPPAKTENSEQPSSPPVSFAEPPKRIFLNVTPDYLIGLFKDLPAYRGRELTTVYLGKWMRLSGPHRTINGP